MDIFLSAKKLSNFSKLIFFACLLDFFMFFWICIDIYIKEEKMQKFTFTTLLFMSASTMAMAAAPKAAAPAAKTVEPKTVVSEVNPSNPFYTPKAGKGMLTVESIWSRYKVTGENDTYFDSGNSMKGAGMYGITDNLSVVVKLNDDKASNLVNANVVTGNFASSPSVGVKYVGDDGMFRVGGEANYGFKLSEGAHTQSFDTLDAKLTAGIQEGPFTLAAFAKYVYAFDFREKEVNDVRRVTGWYYGLEGQYQVLDSLSVDFGWTHQFKHKVLFDDKKSDGYTNEADTFQIGLTWEAVDNFYVTPYFAYHKLGNKVKEMVKDASSYGLKFAVTF